MLTFASQLSTKGNKNTLCKNCKSAKKRVHSSAGSEHLPYKQGVQGSNPCGPTIKLKSHLEDTSKWLFSLIH